MWLHSLISSVLLVLVMYMYLLQNNEKAASPDNVRFLYSHPYHFLGLDIDELPLTNRGSHDSIVFQGLLSKFIFVAQLLTRKLSQF